ncbi:MAG: GlsB/YeaQ/YmgE family stress response membrane protein [Actinomycetota bacterium]
MEEPVNDLISIILVGAMVGALARLVLPGRQPIGIPLTIGIGFLGALIGNRIGEAVSPDGIIHWILSVLVAVALIMLYMGWARRSRV